MKALFYPYNKCGYESCEVKVINRGKKFSIVSLTSKGKRDCNYFGYCVSDFAIGDVVCDTFKVFTDMLKFLK